MAENELTIKLYSILRDYAGAPLLKVKIEGPVRVGDLINKLLSESEGLRRAVEIVGLENIVIIDGAGKRLNRDSIVAPGTQLHIMPPPEGGSAMIKTGILPKGASVDIMGLVSEASASAPDTGGIGIFIGVVRGVNPDGSRVEKLSYEAAVELAEGKIKEIAETVAAKHSLSFVAAYHYYGDLRPGDITMVIVTAGTSRRKVFPALEEIVERIKHELPIWKKEYYIDGGFAYILGGRKVRPKS
ncbi:MAG: molybdenum cofactor biosynthesis protein MoaE [Desulfurococcales archaeon]|nr:molybdenum cofactor biosynthesis protein MoaE [Desulfurococcales archaeon]